MIVAPPLLPGAVKVTLARALPPVAVPMVGAPGMVAITIEVTSVSVPVSRVAVTVTVPTKVPSALGVPVINPSALMAKAGEPVGNPVADQVLPPPPPVDVIWKLYGTPKAPPGGLLLITGAWVTVNRGFAMLLPLTFVTATLRVPTTAVEATVMLAVSWLALRKVVKLTVIPSPKFTVEGLRKPDPLMVMVRVPP